MLTGSAPTGEDVSSERLPPSLSPLGHRPPCLRPAAPKRPADHSRTGRHPAGPSPGPWARPPLAAASSSPFRAAFPSAQTCACAGLSLRRPSSPEPRAGWRAPNTRGAYLISVLQLECPAIPVRRPPRARNILPRPALLESGHVTRTALGPREQRAVALTPCSNCARQALPSPPRSADGSELGHETCKQGKESAPGSCVS